MPYSAVGVIIDDREQGYLILCRVDIDRHIERLTEKEIIGISCCRCHAVAYGVNLGRIVCEFGCEGKVCSTACAGNAISHKFAINLYGICEFIKL